MPTTIATPTRPSHPASRFTHVALAAGGAVLLLAATGCGAGASSSAADNTSKGSIAAAKAQVAKYLKPPTTINQTKPLKQKPATGKKIIYLQQGAVPSIVAIGDAVEQASKALGWSVSRINYDPSSPASLQNAFNSALVAKPDAVMVTGLAPNLYGSSVISAYRKAGIPIIVGAAGPVHNDGTILGTAASPANSAFDARLVADWFISDSHGKGSAIFVHIPSFTTLAAEAKAFDAEIKKDCSGCTYKTVNVTLDQVGSGAVPGAVVSALQSNPDAKYVLFDDGDWAGGISAGLKAAGLNVKVGGVTATPEQFKALQNGEQSMWTGYNFAYNGYGLVDIAARHFEGDDIPTGKSGDEIMPTQILTPHNVGSATAFTSPEDSLAQFEKLWQLR